MENSACILLHAVHVTVTSEASGNNLLLKYKKYIFNESRKQEKINLKPLSLYNLYT